MFYKTKRNIFTDFYFFFICCEMNIREVLYKLYWKLSHLHMSACLFPHVHFYYITYYFIG